ncbi:MAG: hypothetical protein DRP03_03885 [Candidatus Aenigmatarchaeota archaeon]|nr:MAG: hypothetical protein DRP03_03885 [Candidatus Aenigmarchaeota archaeon]
MLNHKIRIIFLTEETPPFCKFKTKRGYYFCEIENHFQWLEIARFIEEAIYPSRNILILLNALDEYAVVFLIKYDEIWIRFKRYKHYLVTDLLNICIALADVKPDGAVWVSKNTLRLWWG